MIPMTVVGVRLEFPSNQPIVLLREVDGIRFLPIFIGGPEATAIAYALEGVPTPRPMTHDLFKTVLDDREIVLKRIDITALEDRTFFALLYLDHEGDIQRVDARPSDALALAVRYGADSVEIYADEAVLAEAAVELSEELEPADTQVQQFREFLDTISPDDFV